MYVKQMGKKSATVVFTGLGYAIWSVAYFSRHLLCLYESIVWHIHCFCVCATQAIHTPLTSLLSLSPWLSSHRKTSLCVDGLAC